MRAVLLGMIAGIVGMGYAPALPAPAWQVVAGAIALLCLFRARGAGCSCWRLPWLLCTGVSTGVLVGTLHGQALLARALPAACVNSLHTLQGRVATLPAVSESGFGGPQQRFQLHLEQPLPFPCHGPQRLLVSYYGQATIGAGELWQFTLRVKRPRGLSNPASHDRQYWFAQAGIHALGVVKGEGALVRAAPSTRVSSAAWRSRIREQVQSLPLRADVKAVILALAIADKSALDAALWQQFTALGINHLLVISGLHVGLVAGLGLLIARMMIFPLRQVPAVYAGFPALIAIAASGSYMAMAGFSLPTQRAFTMLLVYLLATAIARRQPALTGLLYAAAVVLLINPLAALGSGFWLSFGAVLALLWLGHWQAGGAWLWRFLATHCYMTLVMLPLGAFFFGGASILAMAANAILIPLIGMVVVPLVLAAALSHLLGWWAEWVLWIAAGELLALVLDCIAIVTRHLGGLAFQYTAGGALGIALAGIACCLLPVPLGRHLRASLLLLFVPLLLPRAGATHPSAVPPDYPVTTVTTLDVGQGTAVVVSDGQRVLLYDTGGGVPGGYTLANAVVLPYLRNAGYTALDTLVVSHQDTDHSAGLRDILRAFPVQRLRYGGQGDVHKRGMPCRAGEAWRWPGGQVFRVLSPALEPGLGSNNGSCVVQLEVGDTRVLLAGDIEGKRERSLAQYWRDALASHVLLVAHHGSKTSSYWSFLKRVMPAIAIASVGYANRFGHPHPGVVARLQDVGATVYDTPASGAITIEIEPSGEVSVREHRARARPYWM